MTTSKLFVAAIAMSTVLATPAFAQWRSQENGDRNLVNPATRDTTAYGPSVKSPRPTVIRATKGQ